MAQVKIKQINGLQTALDSKVESASNQGAGQGLFKQKTTTDLEFYTIDSGEGVDVNAPATDVITLDLNLNTVATTVTDADDPDLIAFVDVTDNTTKLITRANFLSELNTTVDRSDFTEITDTADADEIIVFDASDTFATRRETKANFLQDYAKLASPAFTGTPTAPTAAAGTDTTQLATTAFVQTAVTNGLQGLDPKESVRVASAAAIADLSDVTVADFDGTGQGVTLVEGDRVLVKDTASADGIEGASAVRNGIYVVGTVTTGTAPLTRSADADEDAEVTANLYCWVEEGSNADNGFVLTTDNPITVDTTALTFVQFSGAGQITAGDGLAKSGNTLSVNVDGTTIEIATDTLQIASTYTGQTSITTLGTITTGTWNGTEIGVIYGGTGLTTVAANSVLASQGTADTIVAVNLTASTVLGRGATGNITALSGSELRIASNTRQVADDSGTLTSGSMTLGTLSQTPLDNTKVQVFINGILIRETDDYTISGTTVTATSALNVAYGGTASDGLGFENDDEFTAHYEY